jgi:hypothetical protein
MGTRPAADSRNRHEPFWMDETTIMKVMGHKTSSMFKRYQIRDNRDVIGGFKRLDTYREQQIQSKIASPKIARGLALESVPLQRNATETPQLATDQPSTGVPTDKSA